MSSPNTPQSAPSSGPAVDTRSGRGIKEKGEGGGAIAGVFKKITKKMVWVFAGVIFAGVFFWGVSETALNGPNPNIQIGTLTGHFSFDRFLLLGGILCLIPPAIMYLFESKRRDAIDNNIPHLIRDIADAGRSGMTLTRAIEISAERDYGPLTKEIKKLIAKISFRVPLERALQFFADRTGTMLSRRTAMLVAEANKSG
ncbi:MAG TPA: type II secretion system F family protein, partial [Candidatus Angelobacter sp.]|nr:type II secretion system F family protein [Candidatus Angelobacter sp.]